jgi:hypothetical protein
MHGQTAGHADGLASYEIGVITRQECNDTRQIRGLAEAFERYGLLKTVKNLLAVFAVSREGVQQRRIGRAGANRIHDDVDARSRDRRCGTSPPASAWSVAEGFLKYPFQPMGLQWRKLMTGWLFY